MPDSSKARPAPAQGAAPVPGLRGRLDRAGLAITAEVAPPLTADPHAILAAAAPLLGRVDAINVTDAPGARAAVSSLAAAAILRRAGHDPVMQVTCRDRNRIALSGELLGAAALGIGNILVLHGDDPARGDMPEATPVYDLDSREVMRLARAMRDQGVLPSGRTIQSPPAFFIGAADAPHDPAPDWRPDGLIAKQQAGAEFVQTQFCFDAGVVRRYVARLADFGLSESLRLLIGVGPLASAASARWMNDKLFGVQVPEAAIARMERAQDPEAEGLRICVELIQELRRIDGVAGVHIMAPLRGAPAIAEVIEALGER